MENNATESNYTIGYVDEESRAVNLLQRALRRFTDFKLVSYKLDSTTSLENILDQIVASEVELLLLDQKLEGIGFNGSDIDSMIDERYPHFPWFMFTNNYDEAINHVKDLDKVKDKKILQPAKKALFQEFVKLMGSKIDASRKRITEKRSKLDELLIKGDQGNLTSSDKLEITELVGYLRISSLQPKEIRAQVVLEMNDLELVQASREKAEAFIGELLDQ